MRLAHTLRMSELQLLWGLPDKIAYEATVKSAWVLSPDLVLDQGSPELRAVVRANLERGVEYRYLVPSRTAVTRRARQLLREAPAGARLSVRVLSQPDPLLVTEVVLYDARTPQRLGLMIAPTDRPDVDCVLGAVHAQRLVRAFENAWHSARPLAEAS